MILTNKKLYYQYFDLYRVSSFLGDLNVSNRAYNTMNIINENINFHLLDCSFIQLEALGFHNESIYEILEYKQTNNIDYIESYKNKIEPWIKRIILPDFFDVKLLQDIFNKNGIRNRFDLLMYFQSNQAKEKFGIDKSSLYAYYISNIEWENFPLNYRNKYNNLSEIITSYNGKQIKGNFHNHTIYSDGRCNITDLSKLAINCGRNFIGISDHSKRLNGITEESIDIQHTEIGRINKMVNITILKSIECEILKDGSLDFETSELQKFDYVIAAVHRDTNMTKNEATNRLIKAIENDYTTILAHPSSRIYNRNVGLYLDMKKIIDACVDNNVIIEINGDPDRLDLDPSYINYALKKGGLFSVDSDTHSPNGFMNINNAIHIAYDNNIPSEKIINTWSLQELIDNNILRSQD